jgi:ABC-type proline/glycine betaine transport system ATPase subunit
LTTANTAQTEGPSASRQAASLEFREATKRYPGTDRPALDGLTLDVPAGDICVLVGPSGCGKTTAMRMVNRMPDITGGDILVGGRSVRDRDEDELRRDIDEAIKMGDRIAVMQEGGVLAQYAPPADLLMRPANAFVQDFVGADRALKRLSLQRVRDVDLISPSHVPYPPEPVLGGDDLLRDALSEMLAAEIQYAPVAGADGDVVGVLSIELLSHTIAS